jgi:Domain of unknown function (DUF2760)
MEMFLGGLGAGLILGLVAGYFLPVLKAGGKTFYDLGLRVARKSAGDAAFAAKVEQLFVPPPPPKPSAEPVRILGILQREARLLDFLMENIQAYEDAQIGASVRDIHAKSQAALKKHVTLESVLPNEEGSAVTVQAGFDPSAIRLVGNVTGNPPFKGTLQHAGWRAKSIDIPKPPEGVDDFVLMPAEVELS